MWKPIVAPLVLGIALVGCSSNMDNSSNKVTPRDTNTGIQNNTGINDMTNPTKVNNNNHSTMRVADKVAKHVTGLKEVRKARVITTDQTAYVAATLEDGGNGNATKTIKSKIADRVREADKSINQVYVSTNPDFIDRMEQYSTDIGNGKPISGLLDEFNETVRRVFPNAR